MIYATFFHLWNWLEFLCCRMELPALNLSPWMKQWLCAGIILSTETRDGIHGALFEKARPTISWVLSQATLSQQDVLPGKSLPNSADDSSRSRCAVAAPLGGRSMLATSPQPTGSKGLACQMFHSPQRRPPPSLLPWRRWVHWIFGLDPAAGSKTPGPPGGWRWWTRWTRARKISQWP